MLVMASIRINFAYLLNVLLLTAKRRYGNISIEFVIVRYVCKGVSTFHCIILPIKCIPSNKLHVCSWNWVSDRRRKFSWSFLTLKEWDSVYLFTAQLDFARVTWGTFYFSFYSHFLIGFYFVINDCLSTNKITGFFVLLCDNSGVLEKD